VVKNNQIINWCFFAKVNLFVYFP